MPAFGCCHHHHHLLLLPLFFFFFWVYIPSQIVYLTSFASTIRLTVAHVPDQNCNVSVSFLFLSTRQTSKFSTTDLLLKFRTEIMMMVCSSKMNDYHVCSSTSFTYVRVLVQGQERKTLCMLISREPINKFRIMLLVHNEFTYRWGVKRSGELFIFWFGWRNFDPIISMTMCFFFLLSVCDILSFLWEIIWKLICSLILIIV